MDARRITFPLDLQCPSCKREGRTPAIGVEGHLEVPADLPVGEVTAKPSISCPRCGRSVNYGPVVATVEEEASG